MPAVDAPVGPQMLANLLYSTVAADVKTEAKASQAILGLGRA